jgi:anionic cell wall polymer biosynthesis LytR-Cps2A-Psr (LCP) family protein
VHANWSAVVGVVDAIGGIDIAVEYNGNKDSYSGDLPALFTTDKRGIYDKCVGIDYKVGSTQHLNGDRALALARLRGHCSGAYGANGNWSRELNQQLIIEAVVHKMKQTNFVTDFKSALMVKTAIGDNIRMDFEDSEYRTLFALAGKVDVKNIQSISITHLFRGVLASDGLPPYSYVVPKGGKYGYSQIQDYVKKKLDNNPAVAEGAKIDVLNGSGEAGVAKLNADKLEAKNFTVGKTADAPAGLKLEKTTIYVLNQNMPGTRNALVEMFGDNVVDGAPAGYKATGDFVVVVVAGE